MGKTLNAIITAALLGSTGVMMSGCTSQYIIESHDKTYEQHGKERRSIVESGLLYNKDISFPLFDFRYSYESDYPLRKDKCSEYSKE